MSPRKHQNYLINPSNSSPKLGTSNCESKLSSHLHTALSKTVDKYVASLRYSLFKEKFRKIYEQDPEQFQALYTQLCTQLILMNKEDLNNLCQEKNIDYLLFSLENTIKKYQDNVNQEAWRPSGNAKEDLRDHVFAVKLKHKELLQQQLDTISSENEALNDVFTVSHTEILRENNYICSAMGDLKKLLDLFKESKFAILEETLRDMVESNINEAQEA